jgi:uncharacterized protein (TIGR02186 family)
VKRAALLLAAAPLIMAQAEPKLVPDISSRSIEIRYSFTGAQLLLFGAIIYPGGRVPRDPADVIVVLKGPVEPILMREKQKIAGIWMNADSNRFASAPSYYAVASSAPVRSLVDERTAAIYELGLQDLQLSTGGGALPEKERRFESGLLDLKREIEIGKSGFERFVALAAARHGFLYGLAAVLLSLGLGWAAAMAFRRRA